MVDEESKLSYQFFFRNVDIGIIPYFEIRSIKLENLKAEVEIWLLFFKSGQLSFGFSLFSGLLLFNLLDHPADTLFADVSN
jgi:hypothetical protein